MKTRAVVMGFCASVLLSGGVARADVWEFDRQGNVLRSPDTRESDNVYYDENVFGGGPDTPVSQSTRNVSRAIYQPMAEGVAEVYAADPAVAGAGLEEADFVRLFVALIDQESRFDPAAVSPKGARGLGQLMPETAALLGVDAGEPMANLHGAARYLTAQLAEFGRVDLALAAYNAGPQRVEQFHGIPPFRETRDYVAKITAAAALTGGVPAAADIPRPTVGRAFASPSTPELETDVVEPVSLAAPAQGTVLEWKR
ncbi:lytic transglycosylase domain-containing protein [Amaricoccus macauensis]|nr:lytic transglycosylase domain-containing protein [Amaricoccus macauensis]